MAWSFDETNDYVAITDAATLTLPDGDWTIGFKVRLDDNVGTEDQYCVAWGTPGATPSVNIWFRETSEASQPDKLSFRVESDNGNSHGTNNSASDLGTSTEWQSIMLMMNGANIELYADNVLENTQAYSPNTFNVAENLVLGAKSDLDSNCYLGGDLAHVAKWDRALASWERLAYSNGLSPMNPLLSTSLSWYCPGNQHLTDMYEELQVPLTVTNNGTVVAEDPFTLYQLTRSWALGPMLGTFLHPIRDKAATAVSAGMAPALRMHLLRGC